MKIAPERISMRLNNLEEHGTTLRLWLSYDGIRPMDYESASPLDHLKITLNDENG